VVQCPLHLHCPCMFCPIPMIVVVVVLMYVKRTAPAAPAALIVDRMMMPPRLNCEGAAPRPRPLGAGAALSVQAGGGNARHAQGRCY
jgi:hypothetical protein